MNLLAIAVAAFVPYGQGMEQWPMAQNACESACQSLRRGYPSQVSFPSDELYRDGLSAYWSLQQSETLPACIFSPKTAQDVAFIVKLAVQTECPFAAKSGGHVPFSGASNVADGITVDLAGLNEVTIHRDKKTVSVGAGNKWVDVYRKLEDQEITVVGGRIADVGVGGLTLGGGISFFSNVHGWACDNIASYEVVIASGDVVNASSISHPDLYWALRGGASNFGLVTKFEMRSYPHHQSLMWVGKLMHRISASYDLIKAFVKFGEEDSSANATVLFSYVYLQKQDQYIISTETDYAVAVPENKHPPVFDAFFDIQKAVQTKKATKTVVQAIEEHSASNPSGLRQSYWTATFRLDRDLAERIVNNWKQEIEPIKHHITGFVPVLTFQLITPRMTKYMADHGGNTLGLDGEKGPLVIATPSAIWTDSAHDELVMSAYAKWLARSNALAKEMGLHHRYLYMNYASRFQDPIAGYGAENGKRLRAIAKKYDPEGVFQILQPGYFGL